MMACERVNSYYGPAHILFDVSFKVELGRATCLLGRNGAGKTTSLRTIMGLLRPVSGRIWIRDRDVTGFPAFKIARCGVGYVPEGLRVFGELSVEDNLLVAQRPGPHGAIWTPDKVYGVFPILGEFRQRMAAGLSGGQRQMLNIARALVGNPQLLLIDEPTEGLAPLVVQELTALLLNLKREGLTLLLAAQNLNFALALSDEIYVLDRGRVVYHTDTVSVARNHAEISGFLSV